ncbi:endospore germination permease [Cohnella sp. REN36]|uniref:GerAB/ArcD/ProY family transporter n=1 Tax=Cohnella sp. REN36 TaxID=2887347 RepID=UPI001D140782|nr:endospore germination permease [Cohnella sp. REN36]MCC3373963.1 spore germination protein [Cohnella sp. REN36]
MKITGLQLFWIILIMDVGMTLVMTLTPAVQLARQDLWMSALIAGGFAMLMTWLITNVADLYPGHDLIRISQFVLGKRLGQLVAVVYLVQWYTITPIVLRQFTDVINVMIMPETPKLAIMIVMLLLITYASSSSKGIVSIGRCSEMLGPVIIVMILLVLFASLNNVNVKNLLPVFADSGAAAIFKGALPPASYLGHCVEYLMLATFLYQPEKGKTYVYWAVGIASAIVTIAMTMTITTIGVHMSPRLWYPFFEMTRKISLFGFVENLDPFLIITWVASVFIKLALYMFIIAYGTTELLGIKSWRRLVILNAPIVLLLALLPKNVTQASSNYLQHYWVPIAMPLNMFVLPLVLLVVGKLKRNRSCRAP